MRKIIGAMLLVGALATPAVAVSSFNPTSVCTGECMTKPGLQFVQAVPVPSPAGTTTTVETTAPVKSTTNISVGTLAGEVLQWIAAAFGTVLGTAATAWIFKILRRLGVETTTQMQEQLQKIVINGINSSAARVSSDLANKGNIEVKNQVVRDTVAYVQAQAPETIKALGLDPTSGKAVEAIKARIETALIDPKAPTNSIVVPNAYLNGVKVEGAQV